MAATTRQGGWARCGRSGGEPMGSAGLSGASASNNRAQLIVPGRELFGGGRAGGAAGRAGERARRGEGGKKKKKIKRPPPSLTPILLYGGVQPGLRRGAGRERARRPLAGRCLPLPHELDDDDGGGGGPR